MPSRRFIATGSGYGVRGDAGSPRYESAGSPDCGPAGSSGHSSPGCQDAGSWVAGSLRCRAASQSRRDRTWRSRSRRAAGAVSGRYQGSWDRPIVGIAGGFRCKRTRWSVSDKSPRICGSFRQIYVAHRSASTGPIYIGCFAGNVDRTSRSLDRRATRAPSSLGYGIRNVAGSWRPQGCAAVGTPVAEIPGIHIAELVAEM